MSWEVFQVKGSHGSPCPRATICRSGYLSLNLAAVDELMGTTGSHTAPVGVELSVDFAAGLVGIAVSVEPNAYSFRLCQKRYKCQVKDFLTWAGIPMDKARQYRPFSSVPGRIVFKVSDFADVSRTGGVA